MKAMILAAGKGTRVRPLTHVVPKPMIPLLGKPVMESILEHLRDSGFDQIVVNTSHLAPVLQDYFRDGSQFGVEIAYSFEGLLDRGEVQGEALGSAGGMKRIQDFSGFFDDTFAVLCGDALVDVDFKKALRFHRERGSVATVILRDVPREEVFRYGVVATDASGRISQFQEKPAVGQAISTSINTGIYIFEPAVFDHIPSGRAFDIGGELFPSLVAAGAPLYGIELPFQWVDIGSVPDYWEASRLAVSGGIRGYRLPGREVAPGVRLESGALYSARPGGDRRKHVYRRWRGHRGSHGDWSGLRHRARRGGPRMHSGGLHAGQLHRPPGALAGLRPPVHPT
jgi:mannose-1-phosphate guanylyltransferase